MAIHPMHVNKNFLEMSSGSSLALTHGHWSTVTNSLELCQDLLLNKPDENLSPNSQ